MYKKTASILIAGIMLTCVIGSGLMAQTKKASTPAETKQAQREAGSPTMGAVNEAVQNIDIVHLNTIGAFSAGFVLQSYGYIGALADTMSKGVYEPELVRSMLAETISYLRNIHTQLGRYQSGGLIAAGDQKFISTIMEIINQLIAEAQALSSFSSSKSKEDLERFENARNEAWKNIKKTYNIKESGI